MSSIRVDDKGNKLSYIDSGLPNSYDNPTQDYVTIFAIHGPAYSSSIFEKILALAPEAGVRFVALNRRDYPGSTPFTSEDLAAVTSGSEDTKAAFVRTRGMEVVTFIDQFIEANALKPITSDGRSGGFALLGWSLGCAIALAAVASLNTLDWATYLRVVILQEPPSVAEGAIYPLQVWSTQIDQSALPPRDPAAPTYVVPEALLALTTREGMSTEDVGRIVHKPSSASDALFMAYAGKEIDASNRMALFSNRVKALVPHMKLWMMSSFAPPNTPSFWTTDASEDDNVVDDTGNRGLFNYRMVTGIDPFLHWTNPTLALRIYKDALQYGAGRRV